MMLSRPWDEFDAYLFDVDGTLIHCKDAVHYFAFCNALSSVANRPLNLDGVTVHGNTDQGILRDAFRLAGISEWIWRREIPKACDLMCSFVAEREKDLCVEVLPGVRQLLKHLKNKGAILGIATGNLKEIGRRKLRSAGLLEEFHFASWSDSFESRSEVFGSALKKACELTKPNAAILVIGDTPADVQAAFFHKLPVIAVATGIYSREELMRERPNLCLRYLSDLVSPY
jgi:phosphoglycolate phosphatase-like HAD superfamily hydrolase